MYLPWEENMAVGCYIIGLSALYMKTAWCLFNEKYEKRDATVDDESHMSKMKSWLRKYDKRDINGQMMYSTEHQQPCWESSSDILLIVCKEVDQEEHGGRNLRVRWRTSTEHEVNLYDEQFIKISKVL